VEVEGDDDCSWRNIWALRHARDYFHHVSNCCGKQSFDHEFSAAKALVSKTL
jgi:hypothetical protein